MSNTSLRAKMETLKKGESIILFHKQGHTALMRYISSEKAKHAHLSSITCSKVYVIDNDVMNIGVKITN